MADWYYSDGVDRFGPVDAAELGRLVAGGEVKTDWLVWREGLNEWEAAERHFPANAPPLPPTAPSDTIDPTLAPSAPMVEPWTPSPSTNPATAQAAVGGEQLGPDGLYIHAPSRDFVEAIRVCMSNYVTFSGRASRSEFWFFTLFNLIVGLITGGIDLVLFPSLIDVSPINTVATLALLLPSLAVMWRRLHDTDRSGWWAGGFYLAMLVFGVTIGATVASATLNGGSPDAVFVFAGLFGIGALVYTVVLIVFMCLKGTLGTNRFG